MKLSTPWSTLVFAGLVVASAVWFVRHYRHRNEVPAEAASQREFRFKVSPEAGEQEAPLSEIAASRASKPVPHWHYVTHGLSEFGVEYTLSLVDDSGEPPVWPMNLLRWVAKRVRQTHERFDPSHSTNLPKGLLDAVSPGVEGLGFVADPDLGVTFVNVIPLAKREWWLLGAWDFDKYLEALRQQQGDLLWRVGRTSVLDGERGQELLARVAHDGSSQSVDFAELAWTDHEMVLDPVTREVLGKFLRYRLAYGREAVVMSNQGKATLSPGDWRMDCTAKACTIVVPQSEAVPLADALAGAVDGAVIMRPNGLRFRIKF
jgi:hypothetical protein